MKSHWHYRIALVLLVAVLLASVALNLFLYRQSRWYYLQLNETRLDPLGLGYYPIEANQQSNTDPARKTVVFLGDSRAAEWPSPALDQFEFVNRGIGSQTTAQVSQRFDYHIRPLHPHIVIIQVGTNDLKTIPLFPEQRASIVADCKANIQRIVERSVNDGAQVILTTIFPLGQVPLERRPFWSDDVAIAIDDVNKYIASLKSEEVKVFDTGLILADGEGTVKSLYSKDFLHLNAQGYNALNAELIRTLNP